MATKNIPPTPLPAHVEAAVERCEALLRTETGAEALHCWAAECHREMLSVDQTWPLVRDRLDLAAFLRPGRGSALR